MHFPVTTAQRYPIQIQEKSPSFWEFLGHMTKVQFHRDEKGCARASASSLGPECLVYHCIPIITVRSNQGTLSYGPSSPCPDLLMRLGRIFGTPD
jgi:hypothetical protein